MPSLAELERQYKKEKKRYMEHKDKLKLQKKMRDMETEIKTMKRIVDGPGFVGLVGSAFKSSVPAFKAVGSKVMKGLHGIHEAQQQYYGYGNKNYHREPKRKTRKTIAPLLRQ